MIADYSLPLRNFYIKKAVLWFQTAADYINGLSDAQVDNIVKWAGIAAAVGPVILIFGNPSTENPAFSNAFLNQFPTPCKKPLTLSQFFMSIGEICKGIFSGDAETALRGFQTVAEGCAALSQFPANAPVKKSNSPFNTCRPFPTAVMTWQKAS